MSKPNTTVCQCWGGSTHGTDDPSVRLCDLCGGTVPTDPASGNYLYLPRATGPAQQQTTIWRVARYAGSTLGVIAIFAVMYIEFCVGIEMARQYRASIVRDTVEALKHAQ